MKTEALYRLFDVHPNVATDTRKISPGSLFFALKGPNFNGNRFASTALECGASYAIIDEKDFYLDERTILVDNVLTALQDLARFYRQQFDIPFLAITGSNGKTTTKELLHAVLSSGYRTYTTQGNLNNHIGIPLTLLNVKKDAQMAIIEMGANHIGEIAAYCQYVLPTHGLITNTGKAHLEGFGSLEGVRKGKGELYDYLRAHAGTAFMMSDYDYLKEMSRGIAEIVTYGTSEGTVTGQAARTDPFLEVAFTAGFEGVIQTRLVGSYNLPNVLAAVAVGRYFHLDAQKIRNAIEAYSPSNSRSQLLQKGKNRIILDAYNANPSSMRSAIENFAGMQAENKILMLGAMAELGDDSIHEHEALIELIKSYSWKEVVLVGGDFMKISHPFISLPDAVSARDWYREQQFDNASVLVKGSRSMAMERILDE